MVHVQTEPHGGVVTGSLGQRLRANHFARRCASDETLDLLRRRSRLDYTAEPIEEPRRLAIDLLAENLLDEELKAALVEAFEKISDRCRQLLGLLTADPPLKYGEIGDLLGMPQGSIGPTRARCLSELRRRPELARFIDRER